MQSNKSEPGLAKVRYWPQHQLRVKKLLQSKFPLKDYKAYFENNPETILQDLVDIDFDIDLKTWVRLNKKRPECLSAIMNSPELTKVARRKVIVLLTQLEEIHEKNLPLLRKLFLKTKDKNEEITLKNILKAIIDLGMDASYLYSLTTKQRVSLLNLCFDSVYMRKKTISQDESACSNPIFFSDFTSKEMNIFYNEAFEIREKYFNSFSSSNDFRSLKVHRTDEGLAQICSEIRQFPSVKFSLQYFSACSAEIMVRFLPLYKWDAIGREEIIVVGESNLSFAVQLMLDKKLHVLPPENHFFHRAARLNTDEIMDYLPREIENLDPLDQETYWILVRLIANGLTNGEFDTLYAVAKSLQTQEYTPMKFANALLSIAYQAGHLKAGILLADHFWKGSGLFPSRNLALAIYRNIVQQQPELLDTDAIDRLSQDCLLKASEAIQSYQEICGKMAALKKEVTGKSARSGHHAAIKNAIGTQFQSLFRVVEVDPKKRYQALSIKADKVLKEIWYHLSFVIDIDLSSRPELSQHLGCLSAHVLALQVMNEMQDQLLFTREKRQKMFKRSLSYAKDFDSIEGADEDLKRYLSAIKSMPNQKAKDILSSKNLPVTFFDKTNQNSASAKPKFRRCDSLPNLPSQVMRK